MNRNAIIKIIITAILLVSMSGCSLSKDEMVVRYNSDTLTLDEYIEKSDNIGANFPKMYCVGNKYVVVASYFGMYLIDIEKAQVMNYVDLEDYGCAYFQGDIITEIVINSNENNIYFYNSENGNTISKIYDFDIKNQTVKEISNKEFKNVELYTINCELIDFDKLMNEESANVKEQLKSYNDIEKSEIYRLENVKYFLVAKEWKISNLKLILINSDTDELSEVQIK